MGVISEAGEISAVYTLWEKKIKEQADATLQQLEEKHGLNLSLLRHALIEVRTLEAKAGNPARIAELWSSINAYISMKVGAMQYLTEVNAVKDAYNVVIPTGSSDESILKEKMKAAEKDPQLAKYLPKKFAGPGGTFVDKYGKPVVTDPESKIGSPSPYSNKKFINYLKGNMSPGKIIPIDSYDSFKPLEIKPGKYNINDDQKLIQRVGMESNLNVAIQSKKPWAGPAGKYSGRIYRLSCEYCGEHLDVQDETVFVQSANGLVEPLSGFCKDHRHQVVAKPQSIASAAPVVLGGRRFREDD